MWQSEFETRTGVTVTAEEYAHIEAVYMMSDLDKDAFCKCWCQMNCSRVEAAKTAHKRHALINRVLDTLMYNNTWNDATTLQHSAMVELSDAEIADLETLGIDLQREPNRLGVRTFKSLIELRNEILNIARTA